MASSITCDISELIAEAGLGVASLLKTEGETSAELAGRSLPPLVLEGKILVVISRQTSVAKYPLRGQLHTGTATCYTNGF